MDEDIDCWLSVFINLSGSLLISCSTQFVVMLQLGSTNDVTAFKDLVRVTDKGLVTIETQ